MDILSCCVSECGLADNVTAVKVHLFISVNNLLRVSCSILIFISF